MIIGVYIDYNCNIDINTHLITFILNIVYIIKAIFFNILYIVFDICDKNCLKVYRQTDSTHLDV